MTSRPRCPEASTPRKPGRAVEREMQLRRIALISDVFHLAHEAGVELARPYHMQEGGEWIGCRHDSVRGNFLSIFKHYAEIARPFSTRILFTAASVRTITPAFAAEAAIAATISPIPPFGTICAPGAPPISPARR